ncbi:MAG: RodZ domain-containing protein [Elusimicrobiota bacterium]|jgi:transcriptional regulator with XRE-family HTH domain
MTPENPIPPEKKVSIGDTLRQGRLRRNLSIPECAKQTRISHQYLEALEEERWDDLPSESHRSGFLRLYSQFLGVPSEEIISHYLRLHGQAATHSYGRPGKPGPSLTKPPAAASDWYPASWAQWSGVFIVCLIAAWGIYHAIGWRIPDQRIVPMVRLRQHASARLIPLSTVSTNKIRINAQADSWLRAVSSGRLLFEGILPAGATKEWAGPGPFELKIGDVKGLTVYWNDQPVDIQSTARGRTLELRLPPTK